MATDPHRTISAVWKIEAPKLIGAPARIVRDTTSFLPSGFGRVQWRAGNALRVGVLPVHMYNFDFLSLAVALDRLGEDRVHERDDRRVARADLSFARRLRQSRGLRGPHSRRAAVQESQRVAGQGHLLSIVAGGWWIVFFEEEA